MMLKVGMEIFMEEKKLEQEVVADAESEGFHLLAHLISSLYLAVAMTWYTIDVRVRVCYGSVYPFFPNSAQNDHLDS